MNLVITGYTTDGQPIFDKHAEEIIRRAIQGMDAADADAERQGGQGSYSLSVEDAISEGRLSECDDPRAALIPGTKAGANHKALQAAANPHDFTKKVNNPMLTHDLEVLL